MKKVLVLCYDFPPLPSIGAQRPYSWFLHLHKYGFYPTVICRKWKKGIKTLDEYFEADEGKEELIGTAENLLIRIPHKQSRKDKLITNSGMDTSVLLRKLLTLYETFFKWIIDSADDKVYLQQRADAFLLKEKVNFILVTGEPFVLFKQAHYLSKKHDIPLYLDYRDGWTTNHSLSKSFLNKLRYQYERIFEGKYLQQAKLFGSVSKEVTDGIAGKFNISDNTSIVIKNGVEYDFYKNTKKKDTTEFSIVYTGTLYDTQPVDAFIGGLEKFITQNKPQNFKVYFIGIRLKPGNYVSQVEALTQKHSKQIVILDSLPFEEMVQYQKNSSLLLMFIIGSQKKGIIGGKTYEYAATRNPILVVQEERTEETPFFQGRDIQTFAFTADEVAEKIESYYNKFQQGISIQTSITDEEIFSISREYQVKLLAEKLNSL